MKLPTVNNISCEVVELHYQDSGANSDKFYRTYVFGLTCYVQYGRRGTEGQWQTKAFSSAYGARDFAAGKIREKEGKGYRHTRSATFDAPPTANTRNLYTLFSQTATGAAPNGPTLTEIQKVNNEKEKKEIEEFHAKLLLMKRGLDAKADTSGEEPASAPVEDTMESKLAAALAKVKAKA